MAFPGTRTELTNWSKSERSACVVVRAHDVTAISQALAEAQRQGRTVIPRGAGHSYTDAALNTDDLVLDLTPMRRILGWDAVRGVMCVEPGVTLREVTALAWRDGWWPFVAPSTSAVTIGGCVAMNVTGKNGWKCGCFGDYVLDIDVLFPTGEHRTLTPERDAPLFQAVVGGLGLLGVITAVTLQLRRITSGYVAMHTRSASSLGDIFAIFAEEAATSDFVEAWIDGFADGKQLGRGTVSCASLQPSGEWPAFRLPASDARERRPPPLARWLGGVGQPTLAASVRYANRAQYWGSRWIAPQRLRRRSLLPYTFYPLVAFTGYHLALPEGVETFQAFVPVPQAQAVFEAALGYAQKYGFQPLWCVIKQHRRDPFLLSYQVDGFSLELNFRRTHRNAEALAQMLRQMIQSVITAGGKFYLAKDHFSTSEQYCASMGAATLNRFGELKRQYDPQQTLQSNLFRRIFHEARP